MKKLNKVVFFPPFIVLMAFIALSIASEDVFLATITAINRWILENVFWFVSALALSLLGLVIAAILSKFGDVRLGGKDAKPELSTFSWFAISLATTMAAGLLLWGPAEPIAHFIYPNTAITGIEPLSPQAMNFAMEAIFLHWTFVSYTIYTIPAIVFAFMFYNAKRPFSLTSAVAPILGKYSEQNNVPKIVDIIVLFSITAGMSAGSVQAFLNISGGIQMLTGIQSAPALWTIVAVTLGTAIALTIISGLQKAMAQAARLNIYLFVGFLAFLFLFSNSSFMLNLGTEAMGGYINTIFARTLSTGATAETSWPHDWTAFHFFAWMAWAPTSGAFMGRIAYGRKIKHVLSLYVLLNASLSALWFVIVSGAALWTQLSGAADLVAAYTRGVEHVAYEMLSTFPLGGVVSVIFVGLICLSFVTAANGNAMTMASLSSHGISPENPEPPITLKLIWSFGVMAFALIMLTAIGIDGARVLANFGGIFGVIIVAGAAASLVVLMLNHEKYDKTI
ncbi:MAG: BCCT family transporter [Spirochaetes bacterium]|nr:BCCT family transporter [Spirochaetota bacterium]